MPGGHQHQSLGSHPKPAPIPNLLPPCGEKHPQQMGAVPGGSEEQGLSPGRAHPSTTHASPPAPSRRPIPRFIPKPGEAAPWVLVLKPEQRQEEKQLGTEPTAWWVSPLTRHPWAGLGTRQLRGPGQVQPRKPGARNTGRQPGSHSGGCRGPTGIAPQKQGASALRVVCGKYTGFLQPKRSPGERKR